MIMEVQYHAVLFKKRFLLIYLIIFITKIKKKAPTNNYTFATFYFDHGKDTVHSPV